MNMKEFPQPTRTAGNDARVVEVFPRGRKPARSSSFWPGESFVGGARRWDLTGALANGALIVAAPQHTNSQQSV